jgi:mono/diheme cytochrome c family protein
LLFKVAIVKARVVSVRIACLALLGGLASCGGGGSAGDVTVGAAPSDTVTAGPNMFLMFPNPQLVADGSFETVADSYASAYYAAIDPLNDKDTLDKWKAANGFGTAAGSLGEVSVVFGDKRDLGYGRRMTARQNPDGSFAAYVENYLVNLGEGYSYSSLNLDAAVVRDTRWHIGTSAIEYSPGPGGTVKFVKFYTFDPVTGQRMLTVDLDGRGLKAMPTVCASCHGGRADPLTPAGADGKPLFALLQNSLSAQRGDLQAKLQMLNVDSFDFSTTPGMTRAELEPSLKAINKMVLCSYPLPAASTAPEDACRRLATTYEWQGGAADMLKAAYGGDGLPNAAFSDTYVPSAWAQAGQTALFRNVLQPACMTCHRLRGTGNQSDQDFISYAKFLGFADRTKVHVFDRGNMPLAKIVYENFWNTGLDDTLATWLESLSQGYALHDAGGAVLRPGRPVADPGPDRVVRQGATTLSAANSQYAKAYSWTIVTNPANGASLANPSSATPTFTATADGTYVLQLVVSNGSVQSAPVSLKVVVNDALSPALSDIRFADIKSVLQKSCIGCHAQTTSSLRPPIFYSNIDRNGDGVIDATDDAWFYKELRGRINFTDIAASPLLRKPSANHHSARLVTGFDATLAPGAAGRANYDLFLNWILNGAPQ